MVGLIAYSMMIWVITQNTAPVTVGTLVALAAVRSAEPECGNALAERKRGGCL
jgi:hypothetical protein